MDFRLSSQQGVCIKESVCLFVIGNHWDACQDIGHADPQADEPRQEAQPAVCRKAVHEIPEEAAGSHNRNIRDLRTDMVDVVALCTCRSQDGRIRDWRSMVAADSPRKDGCNTDHEHIGVIRPQYSNGNRDENAERAPRSTRGKSQTNGHQEEDRRQERRIEA